MKVSKNEEKEGKLKSIFGIKKKKFLPKSFP